MLLPGSESSFQEPGYKRTGISRNGPRLSPEAELSLALIGEAGTCACAQLPMPSMPHMTTGDKARPAEVWVHGVSAISDLCDPE